jgi:hypothetical protein
MFRQPLQSLIDRLSRLKFDIDGAQREADAAIRRVDDLKEELSGLEGQILALYPGYRSEDWPARRSRPKLHALDQRGAWSNGTLTVLRQATEPLTVKEIGTRLMQGYGLSQPLESHLGGNVLEAVRTALRGLKADGYAKDFPGESNLRGRPRLWTLVRKGK